MMKNIFLLFVTLTIVTLQCFSQQRENYWPKQIEVEDNFIITIYAPEPEGFENNILNARAAFTQIARYRVKQVL